MNRLWLFFIVVLPAAPVLQAQNEHFFPPDIFDTHPAALDPSHFQRVFENDRVTVLRVRLGPREKSMMTDVPAHVMTCITDQHVRVIYAHDKPVERAEKAGYTGWVMRAEYALENLTDKPVEWILVAPNDVREPG